MCIFGNLTQRPLSSLGLRLASVGYYRSELDWWSSAAVRVYVQRHQLHASQIRELRLPVVGALSRHHAGPVVHALPSAVLHVRLFQG